MRRANLPFLFRSALMSRFFALFLLLGVAACGPREIGEGSTQELSGPREAAAVEALRLPVSGANNTQRMLYWTNRPDVMQNMQKWRHEKIRRSLGLAPSPEDPAYREVPKQRSPFRQ